MGAASFTVHATAGAQLATTFDVLCAAPAGRQLEVDASCATRHQHHFERRQLGVLADVLHHQVAGDLDLLGQLARHRDASA